MSDTLVIVGAGVGLFALGLVVVAVRDGIREWKHVHRRARLHDVMRMERREYGDVLKEDSTGVSHGRWTRR